MALRVQDMLIYSVLIMLHFGKFTTFGKGNVSICTEHSGSPEDESD